MIKTDMPTPANPNLFMTVTLKVLTSNRITLYRSMYDKTNEKIERQKKTIKAPIAGRSTFISSSAGSINNSYPQRLRVSAVQNKR